MTSADQLPVVTKDRAISIFGDIRRALKEDGCDLDPAGSSKSQKAKKSKATTKRGSTKEGNDKADS